MKKRQRKKNRIKYIPKKIAKLAQHYMLLSAFDGIVLKDIDEKINNQQLNNTEKLKKLYE